VNIFADKCPHDYARRAPRRGRAESCDYYRSNISLAMINRWIWDVPS
jgi:hypothetical protein